MNGTKSPQQRAGTANEDPSVRRRSFGRGFERLLRGSQNGIGNSRAKQSAIDPLRRAGFAIVPSWYFFAADVLLLGMAAAVVGFSRFPLGAAQIILAALAVSLGAVLALIPILRSWSVPGDLEPVANSWRLVRQGCGAEERVFLFHDEPDFVGEVQRGAQGQVTVRPLRVEGPVKGAPELAPDQAEQLARDAAEAYRAITERHARELRDSLR